MVVSLVRSLVDGFTTQAILRVIERYSENENSSHQRFNSKIMDIDGQPYSTIKEIVPRIKQTLYIILSLLILLAISSCTYCTFYYFYIPPNYASVPIYFDYNKNSQGYSSNEEVFQDRTCNSSGRKFSIPNCKENDIDKQSNKLKPPPTAIIDLFAGHTQWQAIVPDVEPVPKSKILDTEVSTMSQKARILQSKQQYFFDILLTLPESDINRDLGMFTVEVDLRSNDGVLLATASRSSMLPYESSFLSFAKQTFLMIPYLLGAISQTRTVSLKCFDRFTESFEYPLRLIEIRLVAQSPEYHPHSSRYIQVTDSELHIGKELNKIQKVMKEWFYSSGMVAISVLIFFYGSIQIFVQTLFYTMKSPLRAQSTKSSETTQTETDQQQHDSSMERHGFYETYTYDIDDMGETDAEYECDNDSADWEQTQFFQRARTGTLETSGKSINPLESKSDMARDMERDMRQEKKRHHHK